MLDEVIKDIANIIKESVEKGVSSLENRVKALEENKVKDGIDGKDGVDGKDAVIDYDIIKQMIEESVSKIEPIKGDKGEDGINGIDGKDGVDGKDAIQIEIIPFIDETKTYGRGCYATHNGGLWRSYENTFGMRGWECIVNGIKEHSIEFDGQRKAVIKTIYSNGVENNEEIKIPAIIHKGIWKEGSYDIGDWVQLSGCGWICVEPTDSRPSDENKAWVLSAKKGGTGASAYDIARKAGFVGSKEDWLESLGKKPVVKVN